MPSDTRYHLQQKGRPMKPVVEDMSHLEDTGTWRVRVDGRMLGIEKSIHQVATFSKVVFGLIAPATVGFVITAYVAFARLDDTARDAREHSNTTITDSHPGATQLIGDIRENTASIKAAVESLSQQAAREHEEDRARDARIDAALRELERRRR